jgi:hypothetical protein
MTYPISIPCYDMPRLRRFPAVLRYALTAPESEDSSVYSRVHSADARAGLMLKQDTRELAVANLPHTVFVFWIFPR